MQLYEHQLKALNDTKNFDNVLYALDMGLGKTFIGSEKLFESLTIKKLVVCQKSKIEDWLLHFDKYYEDAIIYDLSKNGSIKEFLEFDGLSVGVINYDLLFRRSELLKLNDFTLLLDESSLIQNETTKRCKFILKMNYKNVILLSGTVVNGNYEKLWSQAQMLGWNISKHLFDRQYIEYKKVDTDGFIHNVPIGYKHVDRLKRKFREHGSVFVKTDEVFDLPEQTIKLEYVSNTPEYLQFKEDRIIEIGDKLLIGDYMLTERMYEKMLCSQWNDNKLKAYKDLIDSTLDRIIVFYTYTEELEQMKKITDRPISVVNGSIKDLDNYNKFDNSITFVQYQAGAMGLNLQLANKMIYFSLPDGWSEGFEQSKKRIHRIGQNKPCFYYVLLTKNSIELDIWSNLLAKKDRTDYLFSNNF